MVIKCLLLCAVFLFRDAACDASKEKYPSSYGIKGTYFYLNTSPVGHSNLSSCPKNITIHDSALKVGENAQYFFNLSALDISTENCTFHYKEDKFIRVWNHSQQFGSNESLRYYTHWNMNLPHISLSCILEKTSQLTIPGGNISFIPIPHALSNNGSGVPMEGLDEMHGNNQTSSYIVVFENEEIEQMCTFFPETRYKDMLGLMSMNFGGGGYQPGMNEGHNMFDDEKMEIHRGSPLRFCPICPCDEKLGPDLDLLSVEMSVNTSSDASTTIQGDDAASRPPNFFVRDHNCPISFSKQLKEVISDETNSTTETLNEGFRETKDLALHVVVNKLYDEIKTEYEGEWDQMPFDMRKEIVLGLMMDTFHRRRVMVIRKGTKCDKEKSSIDEDTILLYEKKHILSQLEHNPFVQSNKRRAQPIRDAELDSEHAFTLHVLRKKHAGGFSSCAMSNSRQACDLLKTGNFCKGFNPFGSGYVESEREINVTTGTLPNIGKGSGAPPAQDSSGTSPPTTLSSSAQGTTSSQPTEKPSTSSNQNPTPGSGGSSGANQTASPSMTEANQTAAPSMTETYPSEEDNETTLTPTPVSAFPSPSESSTNNSSSGLCFPAEAKVELEDGNIIRMDQLQVGNCIRDETGGFSKVILFTHANHEIMTRFVGLETERADLVLSAKHYIPVNGVLRTAESVKTGDRVYILEKRRKTEAIVTKIDKVWKRGLFNPQTVSGSLAVRMSGEAIVASAYTAAVDPNVAHSLLTPLRALNNFAGIALPSFWMLKNGGEEFAKFLPLDASVLFT